MKSLITRMATIGAALILVLQVTSASGNLWECGERSNLPQEGKNYCAAGDFRQSEINLSKVLNVLLVKHKNAFGNANALSSAQRAFESYREKQCTAENKRIEDKLYHPMLVAQCKTRLTNLRIEELKRMQQQSQ